MRRTTPWCLVLGLAVGVAVLVLVNQLTNLDGAALGYVDVAALAQGRVHELLFVGEVWGRGLSGLPALGSFVHIDAALTTVLLLLVSASVLRRRGRLHAGSLALCVLAGEFVVYAALFGWLSLGTTPVEECGEWLAWMLIGLFYGAVTCVAAAGYAGFCHRGAVATARAGASLAT